MSSQPSGYISLNTGQNLKRIQAEFIGIITKNKRLFLRKRDAKTQAFRNMLDTQSY
jgi:hypothetical protein